MLNFKPNLIFNKINKILKISKNNKNKINNKNYILNKLIMIKILKFQNNKKIKIVKQIMI